MKKVISILLCLVMLISLGVSAWAISSVKITGIKVDKANLTLDVGGSYNLGITYIPKNTTQRFLVFSTSNVNVASIDANGKITAVGAGKAVITVASKSNSAITAKINVTVNKSKPVTLRIEVYDRGNAGGTPPDNNYWTKWIQANYGNKNNVTVKFESSPRFDNNAKLQMWMASGTAPDLCYTNELAPVNNFQDNGGLAPLDEALDKYGKDLKEFLGPDLLAKGISVKDGKRYVLRAKRAVDASETSWIRKDWLDKLGLPMPATTNEWYNAMKAFKEKNPDQMGQVVPFVMNYDVGWRAYNMLETFKTDKSSESRYIYNGRYIQVFAPGVKDGIKLLNKMYNEDLISKEFPLDQGENGIWTSDMINGYGGFIVHNYDYPLRGPVPGIIVNLKAKKPGAELVPCDPFTDKDGKHTKRTYDNAGIQMFVPKTSAKKANDVIKYLNWMTDPDVMFFLQYGEEGKNHQMENGIPKLIAAKGETIMNSGNNIDYTMIVNGVVGKSKEDTMKRNSMTYPGDMQKLFIDAWKFGIADGYMPPEAAINELPEADSKYGNAIADKTNAFYARTITCKPSDFEQTWQEQTRSLLRSGANEMIAQRRTLWYKYHPEDNN
ncbi:MAG TPA: extracellular solute-binding protein [Clostridia bacterium]|nr:extracellular solute-binding protein [Clostridia bacterium]